MRLLFLVTILLMPASFALANTHDHHANSATMANQEQNPPPKFFDSPQAEGTAATCPVTGEAFTIAKDTLSSQYNGKWVYFCCPDCKKQFDKDPGHYLPGDEPKQ